MIEFEKDIQLKRKPGTGLKEVRAALRVVEKIYRKCGFHFDSARPEILNPGIEMIIVRSPLRVTLGGGGTDLPSYYEKFGGFLIAAAIDRYVYITLHENFTPDLIVKYSRLERVSEAGKLEHPIIREAFALLDMDGCGLELASMADIPAGTGLGSSGSFTTALLKALHTHQNSLVHPADLAAQACEIELGRLKEPIGKQDQYIAAYGGITCSSQQSEPAPSQETHARPSNQPKPSTPVVRKH